MNLEIGPRVLRMLCNVSDTEIDVWPCVNFPALADLHGDGEYKVSN